MLTLTGPLPGTLRLLLGLETLDVTRNRLNGRLPPAFAELVCRCC
jgi:hypothetical protein